MARGYLPQAAAQFREAVNHDPTNPYLHLQLAQVLVAIRQVDEAEAAFQRAAALVDDNLMILMALAEFYAGVRQRPADAVALLEKAAKIDPNSAEVRGKLGDMYLYQGRLADAERETAAAVALLPDDARLLCNLGIILLRGNREREAETMLLRARDRNPALPQPRQWLCLLYATQDRIAESDAEFQALTRLIPPRSRKRYRYRRSLCGPKRCRCGVRA